MSNTRAKKPFPAITGGCLCSLVRYRILTSPLFCHACHCSDCQRRTGTAFASFCTIEAAAISIISTTPPVVETKSDSVSPADNENSDKHHTPLSPTFASSDSASALTPLSSSSSELKHASPTIEPHSLQALCPCCKTTLWSNSIVLNGTVVDIRTGTLDIPTLMEPDMHCYIESKVDWILLPEGARTCKAFFDPWAVWPRSSVKRLEACMRRVERRGQWMGLAMRRVEEGAGASANDGGEDGGAEEEEEKEGKEGDALDEEREAEKTPTANMSPREGDVESEEREFERRVRETERGLRRRLERLTLKLEGEEGAGKEEGKNKSGDNEKEGGV